MRDDDRRILLEGCRDGGQRHILLDRRQHLQPVSHRDVELAGGEQLHAVDLGAAHPDDDIEAVFPVGALGHGLVEPAVLGLCQPVRGEDDAILGVGNGCTGDAAQRGQRAQSGLDHRAILG